MKGLLLIASLLVSQAVFATGAQMENTTGLSFSPNTQTDISFTQVNFDNGEFANLGQDDFVAHAFGQYTVTAHVTDHTATAGDYMRVQYLESAGGTPTTLCYIVFSTTTSIPQECSGSDLVQMNAGDNITVYVYSSTGNVDDARISFSKN